MFQVFDTMVFGELNSAGKCCVRSRGNCCLEVAARVGVALVQSFLPVVEFVRDVPLTRGLRSCLFNKLLSVGIMEQHSARFAKVILDTLEARRGLGHREPSSSTADPCSQSLQGGRWQACMFTVVPSVHEHFVNSEVKGYCHFVIVLIAALLVITCSLFLLQVDV